MTATCQPVVLVSTGAVAIAADGINIYWTGNSCPSDGGACNGTVMKMPVDGGIPTTLASGQVGPIAVAVDHTNVYWVDDNSGNGGIGTVMKVLIDGGAPSRLCTLPVVPSFGVIAVDNMNVYLTYPGTAPKYLDSAAMECPLTGDGGPPTVLDTGTDEFGSYPSDWVPWPGGPFVGVAIDATNVYWMVNGGTDYYLAACAISGCNGVSETIADLQVDVSINPPWPATAIAVAGANAFWTSMEALMMCPVEGCLSPSAPITLVP